MNLRPIRPKLRKLLDWVYEIVCSHLPLQRKIVFDNFGGRGMGDDPKYIALYIKEHHPDIKLIWLLADMNTPMPEGVTPVFIYSRKARYHLYTAKIWVDNIKNFKKTPKRKGQFYLQTWHGGAIEGPKCCEALVEDMLPKEYVKAAKHDAECTDLMYTDNDFTKNIYENHYWYHGEVLKCDIPRLSILQNPSRGIRENILSFYRININKKILLYAPTFRRTENISVFKWDYEEIINAISARFGGDFVMLLRLHPNFSKLAKDIPYSDCIISATDYPDMQELLSVSDVLITDYSGCMFDFAITKKPIFLFCPDIDSYVSDDRSLLFDMYDLPFPVSTDIDNLRQSILNFDENTYQKSLDYFYQNYGFSDSGKGCQQVADLLVQRLNKV